MISVTTGSLSGSAALSEPPVSTTAQLVELAVVLNTVEASSRIVPTTDKVMKSDSTSLQWRMLSVELLSSNTKVLFSTAVFMPVLSTMYVIRFQ